ncbi:MAG: metallophosphoesterase [Clostridia bacterium]
MYHYVMSDLHGCKKPFTEMLETIGFSPEDRLYIIGDVIDRGNDGIELLRYTMKTPNITLLLGNHELMMREAIENDDYDLWFYNGGISTMANFRNLSEREQQEILEYLHSLPLFLDLTVGDRRYRLIHGAPMEDEADVENSVWERPEPDQTFFPDKTVIIGHTPTRIYHNKDEIFHTKHFIDIDCGCVYFGTLACLRLEDMKEYYIG